MGKAPAFQIYVKDILGDAELQLCSSSTRGIWLNALCYMWEAKERGKLSGNWQGLAQLLHSTQEEFLNFLNEANDTKFCTIEVDPSVTFPLHVTQSNFFVTVINRRMYREEKERQNTRLRVQKHRGNKASNAPVTVPSSSSSSSSYNSKELHSTSPEPETDSGPPVIKIPLRDKTEHAVYQPDVDEWKEAYPAIDILQELHKIRQWNLSNEKNQKTKSGIRRHITGWLGKAQNRAPRVDKGNTSVDSFELGFQAAEKGFLPNPPRDVDQEKWLEGYQWQKHKTESNR